MNSDQSFLSYGYVRALLTLTLVGVVVALGAYAYLTMKEARYLYSGPTTINVSGEGEVLARPDIGQFTFAVRSEGDDATTAQNASAEATNAIIDFLTGEGVAESDVKTLNYSLNPRYRFEERVCPAGSFCPPGEQIIDGFEVSQTIEVKVRDLEGAGDLISGAGERDATNISGLSFTIDDETMLMAEAREQAIAKAKEKAEELAGDLGVSLVRMTGFWEEERGPIYYDGRGGMEAAFDDAVQSTAPNVPTGENTITSRVNISYEVR